MKKVYFAASIRGGREDRVIYQQMIEELKKNYIVLTEHIGLESLKEDSLTDEQIYLRDIEWLNEADLVICEATHPSLGVGYELAYAEKKEIPVFVFVQKEKIKSLSAMIQGDKYFSTYSYQSIKDFIKVLKNEIR